MNKIRKILSTGAKLEGYILIKLGKREIRKNKFIDRQAEKFPAVIILGGGGYKTIDSYETIPVALNFLSKGYHSFILDYSIGENSTYPNPLIDVYEAILFIKQKSEEWYIDKNKIVLIGFSAGAHLAGLCGAQWKLDKFETLLNNKKENFKPNVMILCYPITSIELLKREKGEIVVANWGKILQEDKKEVDVIKNIDQDTIPTFIWHTRTDGVVSCSQSIKMMERMSELNVPYEAHIFFDGFHGLSTNDTLTNYKFSVQDGYQPINVDKWFKLMINWLNRILNY
ncbi:acetyl esterase [Fusobacterium nucleatum YWH7199]|uniref:alpha/beta hydrolase n=1 Tax=Fusobacterium nucleatum TaxID=851 RepID=UPI00201ADF84|nr:alpha/beta hydrolase [Fusobacterium nucleatum]MCL4581095.1 acetyl esterase [Fusobacterium nucleatum YWH7199]